jgi:hypothetical protein
VDVISKAYVKMWCRGELHGPHAVAASLELLVITESREPTVQHCICVYDVSGVSRVLGGVGGGCVARGSFCQGVGVWQVAG